MIGNTLRQKTQKRPSPAGVGCNQRFAVSGIFFDPQSMRILCVVSAPEPGWVLVTHNLGARAHQCRRIMREWLAIEELFAVDFSAITMADRFAA